MDTNHTVLYNAHFVLVALRFGRIRSVEGQKKRIATKSITRSHTMTFVMTEQPTTVVG